MLSGIGLCDELITRPEESYRPWCVVVCDLETSRMGAPYIYDTSRLRFQDVDSVATASEGTVYTNASTLTATSDCLRNSLSYSALTCIGLRMSQIQRGTSWKRDGTEGKVHPTTGHEGPEE